MSLAEIFVKEHNALESREAQSAYIKRCALIKDRQMHAVFETRRGISVSRGVIFAYEMWDHSFAVIRSCKDEKDAAETSGKPTWWKDREDAW
jgi:hypothetical protein